MAKQQRGITRPPKQKSLFTLTGYGPGGIFKRDPKLTSGPGTPPGGFLEATTSYMEWMWYWASAKVYNDPSDPRQPPFFGGQDWGYQIKQMGGREIVGGAVVDFMYFLPGEIVGVRLQGSRFHMEAGPEKQSYDATQRNRLSGFITIKDVYDQDFLMDESGEAACKLLVETLGGKARINPATSGTYQLTRAPGA